MFAGYVTSVRTIVRLEHVVEMKRAAAHAKHLADLPRLNAELAAWAHRHRMSLQASV